MAARETAEAEAAIRLAEEKEQIERDRLAALEEVGVCIGAVAISASVCRVGILGSSIDASFILVILLSMSMQSS